MTRGSRRRLTEWPELDFETVSDECFGRSMLRIRAPVAPTIDKSPHGSGNRMSVDAVVLAAGRGEFLSKVLDGDPVAIGCLVFGIAVVFGFRFLRNRLFNR